MQPSLHATTRVVHSEMPQGEVADVPDAVLDSSVAFEIGAGFDDLTQFLLQLRRQQGRPARALPIPQTIDALGIVAQRHAMSADPCRPDELPPPGWSRPEPSQEPEDDAEPAHHFLYEPEPEAQRRSSLGGSAEMPWGLLAIK